MHKTNKYEFDCPCCGNPLFKNRNKDTVRCVWCHNIVDYNGNILPKRRQEKTNEGESDLQTQDANN